MGKISQSKLKVWRQKSIFGGKFSIFQINYLMDFKLTEEHLMIKEAARDFARNELLPGVIERDEKQEFPKEQIKKMGELGFLGMMVSPEYGGGGMDTVSYVLAME